MKRSPGVTVIAVVSLLGSVLAMCFGVLTGVMAFAMPYRASSPRSPVVFAAAGAIYFLPGVWGLASGIGLIRLKNWARISTIVFGALLILSGGFGAVIVLILSKLHLPSSGQDDPALTASTLAVGRGVIGGLAVGEIGIGAWWVAFLTRPRIAGQFGSGTAAFETASSRPISITIIAWFMLFGVVGVIFPLLLHSPVPFFLTTLTGSSAAAYMIAMAVILAYCGVGLLRLQPSARLLAIGYLVFGIVNTTVFAMAPGGHARMAAIIESQQAMMLAFSPGSSEMAPFDPVNLIYVSLVAGAIVTLVPLYFLVARKSAFEHSAM